jgi:hypothetical protein
LVHDQTTPREYDCAGEWTSRDHSSFYYYCTQWITFTISLSFRIGFRFISLFDRVLRPTIDTFFTHPSFSLPQTIHLATPLSIVVILTLEIAVCSAYTHRGSGPNSHVHLETRGAYNQARTRNACYTNETAPPDESTHHSETDCNFHGYRNVL